MNTTQEKLFDKLSIAMLNLINDGHKELAERLGDVIDMLVNEDYVLALILAKMNNLPKKVIEVIQSTYNIREVD